MPPLFIALPLAYLLGSIPFGLLITRMAGLGDVRNIGSGNIGATNVLRTGRKKLAALTLLLDGGKGAAAVLLAHYLDDNNSVLAAAICVIIGHIFPVWLRFKGGKGVATAIGVLLALNFLVGLAVCAIWLTVFAFTKISSLSSVLGIGSSWAAAYLLDDYQTALVSVIIALLIVYTHRHNIKRLVQGTELTFKSKAS